MDFVSPDLRGAPRRGAPVPCGGAFRLRGWRRVLGVGVAAPGPDLSGDERFWRFFNR